MVFPRYVFFCWVVRRWRLQHLLEAARAGVSVAEALVECTCVGVVGANEKLDFPDAARTQPIFAGRHHLPAMPLALVLRQYREIVDPAAMTVFAAHGRCYHRITMSADQQCRMCVTRREVDISGRIVPRPPDPCSLPEPDHRIEIGRRISANVEWFGGAHRSST
jgi:hypothetical protein